jgi:hypothetical protein
MSKNIELLKGIFGDQVSQLTEDQTTTLSEKLDKLIDTRVDTKVKFATEVAEAEAKDKYDALLTETKAEYEDSVKTLSESLTEKAEAFKTKLQEKTDAVVSAITEEKDAELAEFKEEIIDKLDKYLDLEVKKNVPDTYVEAMAQVSVLQPIVEGFKKVMEENYIKFDEENFGLLKDAREEIIKVREELAESTKTSMELNQELSAHKKSVEISKVCEGLTDSQREKAVKLLEDYDADEIVERFSAIRDIIIEADESDSDEDVEIIGEGTDAPSGDVETITEDTADDMDDLTEDVETPVEPQKSEIEELAEIFRSMR